MRLFHHRLLLRVHPLVVLVFFFRDVRLRDEIADLPPDRGVLLFPGVPPPVLHPSFARDRSGSGCWRRRRWVVVLVGPHVRIRRRRWRSGKDDVRPEWRCPWFDIVPDVQVSPTVVLLIAVRKRRVKVSADSQGLFPRSAGTQ